MKKLLVCAIAVAALCFTSCSNRGSEASSAAQNEVAEETNYPSFKDLLWQYRADEAVKNVVLVQCKDGSEALVQFYAKDPQTNAWTLVYQGDAAIGRYGYSARKREGDGKTPVGDFGIGSAFGIKPNPGTVLNYIDITDDIYAVDTDNEFYNRIVDASDGLSPREGEHMTEYSPQYNYGLVIDYNPECVQGEGSNIFMHCKGPNAFTGGCVALDEDVMRRMLQVLTPGDRVIIYPAVK